jgi:hypothetical protein
MGDSTRDPRSQIPDARAASPEEEDVNAIPTKGPLGVRKNTIAAKKRATELAKARETARTQSPRSSIDTVQRARRSTRPNIPQPDAMAISPETSIRSQQQMLTDEEEADTESDTARRRRRRSNSANQASSSSEQNSDREPSQARQPTQKSSQTPVQRALAAAAAEAAYEKVWENAPDKSKIVSSKDGPKGVGSISGFQRFLKKKREVEGVPSRVARIPEIKAARDKALTHLWENDPSARKLSVKELVERFNNNPNNADITATADTVKRFRTAQNKKRKEIEPANNLRSNPKDQTKKKRKN